jgi:hypothetical protein
MSSNKTRVVVLATAVLLFALEADQAHAQGEYLRFREFGAEAQFVYVSSPTLSAAGVAAGFSFWGCLDPEVEVLRYSGSNMSGIIVYGVGATAHPLKPFVRSPIQPYASFAYMSAERDRGNGSSEALGVYAQARPSQGLIFVPNLFLAWSDVGPVSSEALTGGGIGLGIKASPEIMIVLDVQFTSQKHDDAIVSFGIGVLEVQRPPYGH